MRRNVDQTNYHLRDTATDLTLTEKSFSKEVLNLAVLNALEPVHECSLSQSLHLKALLDYGWVLTSCVSY